LKQAIEKLERLTQTNLAAKAHDLEMSLRSNSMKLAELSN